MCLSSIARRMLRTSGRFAASSSESATCVRDYATRFSEALLSESKFQTIKRIRALKDKRVIERGSTRTSSAILVSLCNVGGVPSLLYTVRSQDLRNHSGQVSFPGGRSDGSDRDIVHTALREAEEEVGVPQSSIDVWEVLPPIGRYYTNPIHPVVGNLGPIAIDDLRLNQSEVSKVFTVPLEYLCNPDNVMQTSFRPRNNSDFPLPSYTLPVFLTKPRIWGLTAVATELFLFSMYPDLFPKPLGKFLPR